MVIINRKAFETHALKCINGETLSRLTKKEYKIIVTYEGIKGAPDFEKGHFRGSKRKKK